MYINNRDDVRKSHFLTSLNRSAEDFGLEYCFAEITDDNYNGIYFFCGTDINSYLTTDDQIKNVIKRGLDNDCFFTKVKAFKLDGYDDFVTHQHILIYMQNLELLKRVFQEKNIELPKKLSNSDVFNIRSLYANRANAKTAVKRQSFDTYLVQQMKNNSSLQTENETSCFVYDSNKSKFSNFLRKHFSKHPSQVSLNHLSVTNANVETIFIKLKYKKEIVEALDKNQTIPYCISSHFGQELKAGDNEGLGSKELNDTRAFSLSYGKMYSSEVLTIVNKILYPDLFVEDFNTFSQKYGNLIPFSVPSYEYQNILNLLTTNNIPFAYGIQGHDILDLDLVVPQKFEWELEQALSRLANERKSFRICAYPIVDRNNERVLEDSVEDNSFKFFNSINDILKIAQDNADKDTGDSQNSLKGDILNEEK